MRSTVSEWGMGGKRGSALNAVISSHTFSPIIAESLDNLRFFSTSRYSMTR